MSMRLAVFHRPWGDNPPVYVNPANVLAIETIGDSTSIYMSAPQRDGVFTIAVREPVESVRHDLNVAMSN
jgi:hypothetical protein